MAKKVSVYVVRDTTTGLYEAGEGRWTGPKENRRWIPRCTGECADDAAQYDDDDFAETYPNGVPTGWEKIKVCEFETKERK